MSQTILNNEYFLIFILIIAASSTWLLDIKNQYYTKIINPSSVLALDATFSFVFFIFLFFITNKHKFIMSDINKLTYLDFFYFLLLAFLTISIAFIFIELLKIYNLKKIRTYDYLIDVLITIIGFAFLMRNEFTWKKILGLPLLLLGMYLIN